VQLKRALCGPGIFPGWPNVGPEAELLKRVAAWSRGKGYNRAYVV
jgi:hypothetical protein